MTLATITILIIGVMVLLLGVTALYYLYETGVLDDSADRMADWLEKNNTADKFE